MKKRFWLFVALYAFLAMPGRAETLAAADDLKQELAEQKLTFDHYELDREGLNTFYALRKYRPVWNMSGEKNSVSLNAFFKSIEKALTYHGLTTTDYALEAMHKLALSDDRDSHVKLELLVTDTLLRLAHDLHGDTHDLSTRYLGWSFHRTNLDIPSLLEQAVAANNVNELFDKLSPKQPAYQALVDALRYYNDLAAKGGWKTIGVGDILRPKDFGPRIADLRLRLAAEGYEQQPVDESKASFFDDALSEVLKTYQERHGLNPDGHLGGDTLAELNLPVLSRLNQIRANMERWRNMPDDFPPARAVLVNIADASVAIFDQGKPTYQGPVIVGQVKRKTPFIQSVISGMIINPAWHVPDKIARADILPKLRKDPHYLEKLGFVIRDSENDPHGETIDWKNMQDEEFNFRLRQAPGAMNSLGRLKFDFSNDFAVYLHGTPHHELFTKTRRTLSSGCIRLRDPEKVAEIILEGTSGSWDIPHIEEAIATRQTRWVGLAQPIPIMIVYWTVFSDEAGHIQFRNDVYDYDHVLIDSVNASSNESKDPSP